MAIVEPAAAGAPVSFAGTDVSDVSPEQLDAVAADIAVRGRRWTALLEASAESASLAERLSATVLRPLAELISDRAFGYGSPDTSYGDGDAAALWTAMDADIVDAVLSAAPIAMAPSAPAALLEAIAGLMRLSLSIGQLTPDVDVSERRRQLTAAAEGAATRILVREDGPYLVSNYGEITDVLGLAMPLPPVVALCRCGASAAKPICDGSHARIGFHLEKDPGRLRDRRRNFPGPAATIGDNRGVCARSELCSARLPSVFEHERTPFVSASAGRLDEIVRAVLECPSGALTMRIAGHAVRNEDDTASPIISVTRDGPYHVRGTIELCDEDGAAVSRGEDPPEGRFALCRCGQTRNAPLCSGRHRDVHFVDPLPDRDELPSLFEWAGGMAAFNRLMRRFYETYVPADPLLQPLFGTMPADHPERVAAWVAEVFGGPEVYSVPYGGFQRMMSRHLGGNFSEPQRARFVELIVRSADDVGLPSDPEFRAAFVAYFEWGSRIATETSQPGAKPPRNMQMPRWNWIRDAVPGSRPPSFARHERRPELIVPQADATVRFAVHIRPQFRKMDRLAMIYAFDLWNVESVRSKAPAILTRLRDGTMPVDGAWSPEAIDLFARWIESGMSE